MPPQTLPAGATALAAGHDWYREGAEYLIQAQQESGSWPGTGENDPNAHGETELIRTCFALLFLKRATQKPPIPLAPPVLTPR